MSQRTEKVAAWLPAILLISVACVQLVITHTLHMDPWKGGGFGMFATLDGKSERAFSCIVEDREGDKYIVSLEDSYDEPRSKVERVFRKLLKKSYTVPTQNNIKELAEIVLNVPIVARERFDLKDIRWLEEDSRGADLTLPSWINKSTRIYRLSTRRDRDDDEITKIKPYRVDLKVWRLHFNIEQNGMRWEIIEDVELGHKEI